MGNETVKSLAAGDSVLLLIDYQARKFYVVESHGRTGIKNNVMALAQGASILGIPAVLTTMQAGSLRPFYAGNRRDVPRYQRVRPQIYKCFR